MGTDDSCDLKWISHDSDCAVSTDLPPILWLISWMENWQFTEDYRAGCLFTYGPCLERKPYLAQGLATAKGVIEGACRHLVDDRMGVTGTGWSRTGAEAVLRPRALRSSHHFGEWPFKRPKRIILYCLPHAYINESVRKYKVFYLVHFTRREAQPRGWSMCSILQR